MTKQYLTFKISGQIYGFPIEKVREINRIAEVTKVPNTEIFYSGVMNVRGSIISVVSLRLKMGLPEVNHTLSTCTIIVDCGKNRLAVIVDAVESVVNVDTQDVEPNTLTQDGQGYINEIAKLEGQMVMLIDVEQCFQATGNKLGEEALANVA